MIDWTAFTDWPYMLFVSHPQAWLLESFRPLTADISDSGLHPRLHWTLHRIFLHILLWSSEPHHGRQLVVLPRPDFERRLCVRTNTSQLAVGQSRCLQHHNAWSSRGWHHSSVLHSSQQRWWLGRLRPAVWLLLRHLHCTPARHLRSSYEGQVQDWHSDWYGFCYVRRWRARRRTRRWGHLGDKRKEPPLDQHMDLRRRDLSCCWSDFHGHESYERRVQDTESIDAPLSSIACECLSVNDY